MPLPLPPHMPILLIPRPVIIIIIILIIIIIITSSSTASQHITRFISIPQG